MKGLLNWRMPSLTGFCSVLMLCGMALTCEASPITIAMQGVVGGGYDYNGYFGQAPTGWIGKRFEFDFRLNPDELPDQVTADGYRSASLIVPAGAVSTFAVDVSLTVGGVTYARTGVIPKDLFISMTDCYRQSTPCTSGISAYDAIWGRFNFSPSNDQGLAVEYVVKTYNENLFDSADFHQSASAYGTFGGAEGAQIYFGVAGSTTFEMLPGVVDGFAINGVLQPPTPSRIPEPASIIAVLNGLASLAYLYRRRSSVVGARPLRAGS